MKKILAGAALALSVIAPGLANATNTPPPEESNALCGIGKICQPVPPKPTCRQAFCGEMPRWVTQTRKMQTTRGTGRVYGEITEDLFVGGVRKARWTMHSTLSGRMAAISVSSGEYEATCMFDASKGYLAPALVETVITRSGVRMQYERELNASGNSQLHFTPGCAMLATSALVQAGVSADDIHFLQEKVSHAYPAPPVSRNASLLAGDPNSTWGAIIDGAYGGLLLGFSAMAGAAASEEIFWTAVTLGAVTIGINSYYKAELASHNQLDKRPELPPGGTEPASPGSPINSNGWDDERDLDGGASSSEPQVPAQPTPLVPQPPTTPTEDPAGRTGPGTCTTDTGDGGNHLWSGPRGEPQNLYCESGPIG